MKARRNEKVPSPGMMITTKERKRRRKRRRSRSELKVALK
jgi:hypothetical protein